MAIFVAFGVLIALSGSFACDRSAPLPKLGQPFDWSKYNGTWYMTITTLDAFDLNFACLVAEYLPSIMTERGDDAIVIYHNGLRKKMHWRLVNEKNGYYRHIPDAQGVMTHDLSTFLGDYENYLVHIQCSSEGWIIEVFTDVKTVSAELLLRIQNDLLQHGVVAPLRLSRCADIDDI